MIRKIEVADITACLNIYNYYVLNTTYTLELNEVSLEEFTARVKEISENYPYLVFEDGGVVEGYAYVHEFSKRGGYKYTCEATVYVHKDYRGKGCGKALMEELISCAETMGLRDIISVVTGENQASLAFNQALGFKDIAIYDGIAEKFGRRLSVHHLQYKIK